MLENYQEKDGVRVPEVLVPFMGGITFLPFVRDSRISAPVAAPTASAPAKAPAPAPAKAPAPAPAKAPAKAPAPAAAASTPAAAPTPAPASTPAAAVSTGNPAVDELTAKVTAKGEEIRALKASKASKEVLAPHIAELTALKTALAAAGGGGAPVAPAPDAKKAAKSDKAAPAPAAVPAKTEAKKAPAPAAAPSTAKPAAAPQAIPVAAPVSVWAPGAVKGSAGSIDCAKLESWLKVYSYVGGHMPSIDDVRAIESLAGAADPLSITAWAGRAGLSATPATARWTRFMSKISPAERATWK